MGEALIYPLASPIGGGAQFFPRTSCRESGKIIVLDATEIVSDRDFRGSNAMWLASDGLCCVTSPSSTLSNRRSTEQIALNHKASQQGPSLTC